MTPEPRQRRARVCYDNAKDEVLLKPHSKKGIASKLHVKNLESYLSKDKEWTPVIKFKWIALSVLLLRARLFFTAFLVIFVVYSTTQYLLSNVSLELPLISLSLGIVFVAVQNFVLRSHERVISVIEIDEDQAFVRAKYLTPWGVLRHRYATVETVLLTNYTSLDEKGTEYDETHLIWKETEWDGYLKIPITGVQVVNQVLATMLLGDMR